MASNTEYALRFSDGTMLLVVDLTAQEPPKSVAATSGGESCQSSSIASDSASEPSSPSRPVTPLPMPPVPAHLTDHCPYECLRADSEDSGLGPSPAKSSMGPSSPLEGYVSPIQFVPEAEDDEDDEEDIHAASLLDLRTRHQPTYVKDGTESFLPYAVSNIIGSDDFDTKDLDSICQRGNSRGDSDFHFCFNRGDSPNSDQSLDSPCDRSSADIPRDCGSGQAGNVLGFQFLMNSSGTGNCPLSDTASESSVASSGSASDVNSAVSKPSTSPSSPDDIPIQQLSPEDAPCPADSEVQFILASQTSSSSENSSRVDDEALRPCSPVSSVTKDDDAKYDGSSKKCSSPACSASVVSVGDVSPVSDAKSGAYSAAEPDYKQHLQDPREAVSIVEDYSDRAAKPSGGDCCDESRQSSCAGDVAQDRAELANELTSDCTSSSCGGQATTDSQAAVAEDDNVCRWLNCDQRADANANSSDLVDHLRKCHVQSQFEKNETFVCLWVGCKVFERASSSRSWLERHVLLHGGSKPFRCIVDGCRQRFGTEGALQRHVNSHFPQSSRNGKSGHHGDHAGGGPNGRLLKRKRNHRYRRRPHSVKSNDFFDDGIMEQVRHSLLELSSIEGMDRTGPPAAITFHSTVIARRTDSSGKAKVLLHWDPEDMLPDCWVSEDDVTASSQKTIPISSLPPETLVHLDPVYSARLLPRPAKRRRK